MDDLEKRAPAALRQNATRAEDEGLPAMVGRLGEDLTKLFETHLTLLKVEVKEEVGVFARGAVMILAAVVVAAVGLALLNMALAFAASTLFDETEWSQPARYALGFAVVGVLYLVIGVVAGVMVKNRLAKQGLLPRRSARELEKDKEWVKKDL